MLLPAGPMRLGALCLLASFFCLLALASAQFERFNGVRSVAGLLFQYDFTETDDPAARVFQPSSLGGDYHFGALTMHNNKRVGVPADGCGIAAKAADDQAISATITSELNSTNFLRGLQQGSGLTIEMWLKVSDISVSNSATVLAIADTPVDQSFSTCAAHNSTNLVVDQHDAATHHSLVTKNSNGRSCTAVPSMPEATGLRHVVMACGISQCRVYLNNEFPTMATLSMALEFWTSSASLQLVPIRTANPRGSGSWSGEIYMVAAYDRALDSVEVAQNFAAGRPRAAPVARSATTKMFEGQPTVVDFDVSQRDGESIEVFLIEIPESGTVSLLSGSGTPTTIITQADLPIVIPKNATSGYQVHYVPPAFECKPFLLPKFRLYGKTLETAFIGRTGQITMDVQCVNAPPLAHNISMSIFPQNQKEVQLTGSDSNAGDSVTGFKITALPQSGILRVGDVGVTVGQIIPDGRVAYLAPSVTLVSGPASVVLDTTVFEFVAIDAYGLESTSPGQVVVDLLNPVVAVPASFRVMQDASEPVKLRVQGQYIGANGVPEPDFQYSVVLISIAAPKGSLFVTDEGNASSPPIKQVLPVDLPVAVSSGALWFQPEFNFFGTVTFDVVVMSERDGWQSASTPQTVVVEQIRYPPKISAPLAVAIRQGNPLAINISLTETISNTTNYLMEAVVSSEIVLDADLDSIVPSNILARTEHSFRVQGLLTQLNRVASTLMVEMVNPIRGRNGTLVFTIREAVSGAPTNEVLVSLMPLGVSSRHSSSAGSWHSNPILLAGLAAAGVMLLYCFRCMVRRRRKFTSTSELEVVDFDTDFDTGYDTELGENSINSTNRTVGEVEEDAYLDAPT